MYKLRELARDDIKEINKWRNDPDLISCLGAPFRYINEEVDLLWYEKKKKNRNDCIRLAMIDFPDNKILGLASLTNIDYINRSSIAHFMIGNKENRKQGLGSYAIKEILNHAFNNLNLNRVELSLLYTNSVFTLYKKMGFEQEGVNKQAAYKNGKYIDVIEMAILRERYNELYGDN